MASSKAFKYLSGLMVCLFLAATFNSRLIAQDTDLKIPPDTSYFKSADDNWNLIESVLRSDHTNVLMLLNRGANPNSKAEGGMTALMYAAEIGDTMLVKLLVLNGADLELAQGEGTTPLLVAVLNQHFKVTQYLLIKGANPNHMDVYKGSALIYAAALNDYRIADLLLFYGASDTIMDKDGNTALMTAVFFGHLETTDVLLQNELQPDGPDKKGNTPLMIAAQQGNKEMIPLLLEYGAGLEKVNSVNFTPLAHAIQFKQDTAAIILMDSGANVLHSILPNKNIYDLASQQNQKSVLRALKEKGAGPTPRPDFKEIDVGWGNSFRRNEHMMQVRLSLVDRKFGYFAETGIDFRPVLRKVQVEEDDHLIHQYRESRWSWTHGAGKYFRIATDHSNLEYGVYAALYGMLSIPGYKGVSNSPLHYSLVPSAGFYLKGRIAGIKAGTERYTFGTLHEGPWKTNITLFVRISKQNKANVYKDIQY